MNQQPVSCHSRKTSPEDWKVKHIPEQYPGIWLLTWAGSRFPDYRYSSENVLTYTGFTHQQLLSKPLQQLCSAEQEELLREFLTAASFDQSQPFVFTTKNVKYNTKPHISNSTVYSRSAGYHTTLQHHIISFSDNVVGFHNKYADIIFKIFRSLNKENQSNAGIGLAICKKIMDNHDGIITAEGQEGPGAVFSVSFPL